MWRRLALLALALLSPVAAPATEAEVFVEYRARSGSLPPPYAWSLSVTIRADGHLTRRACRGYATEGPDCKTTTAAVDAAGLETICAAVAASALAERPAQNSENIPVGGGSSGGIVHLAGQVVTLPPFPAEADADRVRAVLDAIVRVIPEVPQ